MKKSFLKTKTVHGVKTGNHSNPNVLRAARASGGSCMVDGDSGRSSMTKAPRMKRADGGDVMDMGAPMGPASASGMPPEPASIYNLPPKAGKEPPMSAQGGPMPMPPSGGPMPPSDGQMPMPQMRANGGKVAARKNGGHIMPRFSMKKGKC